MSALGHFATIRESDLTAEPIFVELVREWERDNPDSLLFGHDRGQESPHHTGVQGPHDCAGCQPHLPSKVVEGKVVPKRRRSGKTDK